MASSRYEEDAALVCRARQGDVVAFAELIRAYEGTAQGIAISFCGSHEDARDVVQEALVTAHTKLDQLRESERFGPWFLSIVRSRALSWLHRRRHRRNIAPVESFDESSEYIAGAAVSEHLLGERNGEIRSAIDELPEMYRDVLLLHYWGSYSYDEIADQLGLPHTTVKGRLQQSRLHLRKRLGGSPRKYAAEFFSRGRRVVDHDVHEGTNRIAFTLATGDDRVGMTVSDLDSSDVLREVVQPANPSNVRFSPDGSTIAFSAEGERGLRAIWTSAVEDGGPQPLIDDADTIYGWPVWRPDGSAVSYCRIRIDSTTAVRDLMDRDRAVCEFDLGTRESVAISDDAHKPVHRISMSGNWSGDGNRIAYSDVLHAYGEYFPGIVIADKAEDGGWTTRRIPCAPGEMMTASHTAWSPDGRQIAVLSGKMDRAAPKTLAVFDAATLVQVWSYTGERLALAGFARDGHHLWCATEREFLWFTYPGGTIAARLPMVGLEQYYRRDFDPNVQPSTDGASLSFLGHDDRVHKWDIGGSCESIDLPASELDDLGPVPHRLEETTFTARDGLEIPVKRYVPPSPHDVAVLILGPVIRRWLIARLLRENYEVVEVRWRRQVPDFPWTDWVDEIGRVDAQDAVDCGRDWCSRHGSGRPLAIIGTQAGGFLALRAVREPDAPFACGVTPNAAMSVESFEGGWTGMLEPSRRDETIRERCPITHAGEIRKPLLIVHGIRDTTPSEEPAMIAERVRATGVRCELVLYEDGHLLQRHRDEAMQMIVTFLQEHR